MEQYEFTEKKTNHKIEYGYFEDKVYTKHLNDYQKAGADKILKTSTNILIKAFEQQDDTTISNNILLIGKVQSGKTSNLEMISALLFDNGYNIVIIYGGYDKELLGQCNDRFSETFDILKDDKAPQLITTMKDEDLKSFNKNLLKTNIDDNRPIIITVMKKPQAIEKINELLKNVKEINYKAFIIDDEGDQASLNTNKNKVEGSKTYAAIKKMKGILNDPLYFSVTATPQANIYQPDISALKPDSIHLIHPGIGYTGADVFHIESPNVFIINDNDADTLAKRTLVSSLKNAINYFFIGSVLMLRREEQRTDMIVHVFREVQEHGTLFTLIHDYIHNLQTQIEINDKYLKLSMSNIKNIYTEKYFDKTVINDNPWDEEFEKQLKEIIRKTTVVQQNGSNKISDITKNTYKHIIYIGGDLLQRGITFKKLICTYFARWANSGNMDTTLQRARWFGYRRKYIDLCKVFTTKTIKTEFTNLTNIENDLWDQFTLVENGELNINDIIIDANDTSLNPTRKNVVEIQKTSFTKKWYNQKTGCFREDLNKLNNSLFEDLISKYKSSIKTTTVGRKDGKISASYLYVPTIEFLNFIKATQFIFTQTPFSIQDFEQVLNTPNICIELMFKDDEDYRKRSFNDDYNISALQQGANTTDEDKITYLGDAYVIQDKQTITVQVFRIVPELDNQLHKELTQYMYSYHFPKSSIVYRKK